MAGITDVAKLMVALAAKTKHSVTACFNDIELTAKPRDTVVGVVKYYKRILRRRSNVVESRDTMMWS